ncbi:MAG: hypothetical protein ACE5FL_14195, partial [Myxococcota bacterium]
GLALAEPVDLLDATARWIEVAFEVSPRDQPARAASVYTPRIPAWLEPADEPGLLRVTIDRQHVERALFGEDEPVSGSFSDFVWIFDSASGDVRSADLSGELMVDLDWGLFRSKVRAPIRVEMATGRLAGFEPPRRWLGHQLFRFCDEPANSGCIFVPAVAYRANSGYVNAIGELFVRLGDLTVHTFSPLGEAVFSEAEGPAVRPLAGMAAADPRDWAATPAVSSAPPALH